MEVKVILAIDGEALTFKAKLLHSVGLVIGEKN